MITEPAFWKVANTAQVAGVPVAPLLVSVLSPPHGAVPTPQAAESLTPMQNEPFGMEEVYRPKSSTRTPRSGGSTAQPSPAVKSDGSGSSPCVLDELAIRSLQRTLQFIQPMERLRYRKASVAMGWNGMVAVNTNGKAQTFGGAPRLRDGTTSNSATPSSTPLSTDAAPSADNLTFIDCAIGDTFVALISSSGNVWIAGHHGQGSQFDDHKQPHALRNVARNTRQIYGSGQRLMAVTKSLTVRPLSNISATTKTIIPSRLCKNIGLGLNDDVMMVGADNLLYKSTASMRAVSTPRRVMILSQTAVSKVACGHGFVAVLDVGGRLYTYGRNKKGQIGIGAFCDARRKPYYHSELEHLYITDVSCGDLHTMCLSSGGRVFGCGNSGSGQLGIGENRGDQPAFVEINLPFECVAITCGPMGTAFAARDGTIWTCGSNECGQLGHTTMKRTVHHPTRVLNFEGEVMMTVANDPSIAGTSRNLHDDGQQYDVVLSNNSVAAPPPKKADDGGCCCVIM